MRSAKKIMLETLERRGIRVSRVPKRRQDFRNVGFEWSIDPLKRACVRASTVIDVGVAGGTPSLWKAFPDAFFYLIEPIEEFYPVLEESIKSGKGELIKSAVGAAPTTATIKFNPQVPMQSSLTNRDGADQTTARTIQVDTIDNLLLGKKLEGPIVLKVDVEGHEVAALEGATDTLAKVDAVIIEVSSDDSYGHLDSNLARVTDLLNAAGLRLCEFIHAAVRTDTRSTRVVKADLLYTRRG